MCLSFSASEVLIDALNMISHLFLLKSLRLTVPYLVPWFFKLSFLPKRNFFIVFLRYLNSYFSLVSSLRIPYFQPKVPYKGVSWKKGVFLLYPINFFFHCCGVGLIRTFNQKHLYKNICSIPGATREISRIYTKFSRGLKCRKNTEYPRGRCFSDIRTKIFRKSKTYIYRTNTIFQETIPPRQICYIITSSDAFIFTGYSWISLKKQIIYFTVIITDPQKGHSTSKLQASQSFAQRIDIIVVTLIG